MHGGATSWKIPMRISKGTLWTGLRFGTGDLSRGRYRKGHSGSAPARELAIFPYHGCQYQITVRGKSIDARRRSKRYGCWLSQILGSEAHDTYPLSHTIWVSEKTRVPAGSGAQSAISTVSDCWKLPSGHVDISTNTYVVWVGITGD